MKHFILLFLLIFASLDTAATVIDLNSLPPYSTEYDPDRDPFSDGHAAIKLATETERHVLIELGGDWCRWCHIMDRFFDNNPEVKQQLHNTFVILKVNVSDANDNEIFLSSFPKPLGYPHMYVANSKGSLLLSKDTADFLVNSKYSTKRFEEFIEYWKNQ
jgi:thiol:disulfide interchange protein